MYYFHPIALGIGAASFASDFGDEIRERGTGFGNVFLSEEK